ncbi:putative gpi anchored protein [Neofusicoccum parvum UCRNP2]|uniref:Putative gpi anchored protein n=1 Tax=Botryosphaeria parva (strain UCR-NP2) TaxID=1287680 RepID=R1ESP0_BOTPV|nr:putative gpi anchored protein [Neofusicoccum parvum UCRNP2]
MDFDIDCQTEKLEDGFDTHDCIQGGGASIELNGFWAHMDLYTNLSQNWDFEASIYRIPLSYSLKLLGVGSASLVWEPFLIGGYQLNGSIEIDYGFELTVPDGAGLLFNLSDPDKSTQSKFNSTDGWNITALPFNANAAVDAITITLGLRNALGMHFHFDTNLLPDVTAGAYLDFPVISTKITPLHSGVNASCQPLADSSAADKDVAERVLTNVYHIEPSAVVDVGFYGEILHQDGTLSVYNNTDDPWPLPTACLNFDADAGRYSAAADVIKDATGAGRRTVDPFSAQQLAVGVLCLAAAFMLV